MENETVSTARARGIKLFKNTIRAVNGSDKWRIEEADGFTYATNYDRDPYSGAETITIVQFNSTPNKRRLYARIRSQNYIRNSLVSAFDDRLLITGGRKPLIRSRIRYKYPGSHVLTETPVKGKKMKQVLLGHTIESLKGRFAKK